MAELSVVKLTRNEYECVGSCLRIPSKKIEDSEFQSEWLNNLILDMFETLYSYPSGVGLAANQVGVLRKVCVIDIKRDGKKPIALINPEYCPIEDTKVDSNEVCLSFPGVSSPVKRYKKIEVKYKNILGEEQTINAEGFKANVFQHEIDHVNGIVHIDLVDDYSKIEEYAGYSNTIAKKAFENL